MKNKLSRVMCLLMVIMFLTFTLTTLRAEESSPEPAAQAPGALDAPAAAEGATYMLERTFHYDPPVFSPNEFVDTLDVSIPQATWLNEVGAPMLPAEYVSVTLPPGQLPVSVRVTACEPEVIDMDRDITPVPERIPISSDIYNAMYGDQPTGAENFNKGERYQKNEFYPAQDLSFTTPYGISPYGEPSRSDIRLTTEARAQYVMVVLYPMKYNPVADTAFFYPDLELTIEYAQSPVCKTRSGNSSESYDMVIVTPRTYVPTFENLAGHRNFTGIMTRVVAVEDVYSGRFFTVQGVDNPERIKYFLKDAIENWNITYVILGGDSGQIPIRYTHVTDDSAWNNVPCDLYYQDIYKTGGAFADWQVDGDSLWGETDADMADVDLVPDLVLGRLPATSVADAQNMISKIKNYDNMTYGADWFKNITTMGLDTFGGDSVAEGELFSNYLINHYYTSARGWTNHTLFDSNGKCSASYLLQAQNHHVGFLTFSDHGYETGWASRVSTSDVNSFTNTNELPIVSVDACLCGAFDTDTCFAESFLKKGSNQGGICALASSRISLGVQGSNHINAVSGFYNRVFHYSYTDDHVTHAGEMFTGAQNLYYTYQNPTSQGADYLMMNEYCFFGDPATFIGGFPLTHGSIYCDDANKSADPGMETIYNISLNNTGDAPALVKFMAQRSNGGPVPMDWKVAFTQPSLNVLPHTNVTVYMNITVPAGANANEVLGVTAKAFSYNMIESPLVIGTTTSVNTIYKFEFKCNDSEHTIDPQTATSYNLSVTNKGNDRFWFDMAKVDAPDGWLISLSSMSIELLRDQAAVVNLTVTPGPMVLSNTYYQAVECALRGWSGDALSVTVTTFVTKSNGFNITALEPGPKDILAGATGIFNLSVLNLGNHADAVGLSLLNKGELPGWLISFDPSQNVYMDPFSSGACAVKAVPPSDSLAGNYEICIQGSLFSDAAARTVTLVARVPAIYGFSMVCEERDKGLSADTQVTFDLVVKNNGNIEDTLDMTAPATPAGWTVAVEPILALSSGSSQAMTVTVTPPSGEFEAGIYNMSVEACSRGSGVELSVPLSVEVPIVYGLSAFLNTSALDLWPGQMGNVTITIENTGNTPETFSITHTTLASWDMTVSADKVPVGAFSGSSATISITAPANALSSTYTVKIKVRSQGNSLIEQDLEVAIDVKQVYGLSLEVLTEKATIKDKGNATFKFRLTNLGNGPDTFDITLDGIRSGWDVDTTRQFELLPQQSITGVLVINVPESAAQKGVYDIGLLASSKGAKSNGETIEDNATFTLEVKKSSKPLQDIIGIDNEGSGGLNMLYIIIPLLVLILVIALVIILVVARKRAKKERKPATSSPPLAAAAPSSAAAPKPAIRSPSPEYATTAPTVESGKVEKTPVYAVSKPPPAESAPPAEDVTAPPLVQTPPPPEDISPEPEADPISSAPEPPEDMGLEWED